MTFRLVERPSPNFNERPGPVDMLVMHYTGTPDAEGAMKLLTDGASERRVSAHYTLDEDGTVYAHVPENLRAWHAGVSWWGGRDDVNSRSVGIEIVNPGHEWGYRPFPEAQIETLIALAGGIMGRHGIKPHLVVGHSDIAPSRKLDPGELFPWARLADHGIGIWAELGSSATAEDEVAVALRLIGYGVPGEVDTPLETVISAFQRRFRPRLVDGVADLETRRMLASLRETLDGAGA